MKKLIVKISLIMAMILVCSCATMHSVMNTMNGSALAVSGVAMVDGRFRVELVECVGNVSTQQVTAIFNVINIGPNINDIFIGGSSDNTLAIDGYGNIYKPYSSSGKQYPLPTNVTVRVLVDRISPVLPNVGMLRTLRVNIGNGRYNIAEFRNIPIIWSN